jgi:hypothetical protein
MNFFDFVEGTRQISIAKDIYIFVAFWIGLTAVTAAPFFVAYMRRRTRLKKVEDAAVEAIRQTSDKLAGGLLSSTSGFERRGMV